MYESGAAKRACESFQNSLSTDTFTFDCSYRLFRAQQSSNTTISLPVHQHTTILCLRSNRGPQISTPNPSEQLSFLVLRDPLPSQAFTRTTYFISCFSVHHLALDICCFTPAQLCPLLSHQLSLQRRLAATATEETMVTTGKEYCPKYQPTSIPKAFARVQHACRAALQTLNANIS